MIGAFGGFDVSASGLTADQEWLNVVAENLANMNTTITAAGTPYQQEAVVMAPGSTFAQQLQGAGVHVAAIVQSNAPFPLQYDPQSPLANAQGFVRQSNVNEVAQMTDLTAASASYQANVTAMSIEEADAQQAQRILQSL